MTPQVIAQRATAAPHGSVETFRDEPSEWRVAIAFAFYPEKLARITDNHPITEDLFATAAPRAVVIAARSIRDAGGTVGNWQSIRDRVDRDEIVTGHRDNPGGFVVQLLEAYSEQSDDIQRGQVSAAWRRVLDAHALRLLTRDTAETLDRLSSVCPGNVDVGAIIDVELDRWRIALDAVEAAKGGTTAPRGVVTVARLDAFTREFTDYPTAAFVGEYMRTIEGTTAAPKMFHLMAALTLLSACLGRAFGVGWYGRRPVFPSLWIAIVAPSTNYHKSTATGRASRMVRRAAPGRVLPGDISPVGFIKSLVEAPNNVGLLGPG